jgi:transcriptional regulator with XRE-family HTH domain
MTTPPTPKLPPRCLALLILRTQADKTQDEVAAASGVSTNTLSEYERGLREPPEATLEHIAGTMGYSPATVKRVLLAVGEICDGLRFSADPKHELAAEVGRYAAAVTLLVLTRLEDEEERRRAREVWDGALRALTAPERLQLLEALPELHTWAVVEVLCAESERAAAQSAVTARELAEVALRVADRGEPGIRLQAQAYAWPFMGNSLRVAGKLNDAEAAFVRAASLAQAAGGALSPLDGMRRLDLEASLRRDQRRPLEALNCSNTPGKRHA